MFFKIQVEQSEAIHRNEKSKEDNLKKPIVNEEVSVRH